MLRREQPADPPVTMMISWMHIIDIGHTAVMIPTAAAIAAWLVCAKAWKLALWWCLIFASGLGLVALSKMAFLGWGTELPSIAFKALSGHAWRATAVLPVLFFLLLQPAPARWRVSGALLGVLLGAGLGALLAIFRFHTAAEVIASFVLGSAAAAAFILVSQREPALAISRWLVPASVLVFAVTWGLKPSKLTPRLVDVALYFSGRDVPYRWRQTPVPEMPMSTMPKDAKPLVGHKLCLN